MPNCPTCKKPMDFDRPTTDFAESHGESYMQHPFPVEITMTMFHNYVCENCGSRIRQAVQIAVYKNPEVKELIADK
jgi:DNA-directed RNA polymerase subunit RPC12/RpoP